MNHFPPKWHNMALNVSDRVVRYFSVQKEVLPYVKYQFHNNESSIPTSRSSDGRTLLTTVPSSLESCTMWYFCLHQIF